MKAVSVLNTVAWSGFWVFGYLALTDAPADATHMTTATLLAALGAGVGLVCYFQLVRHAEATGYAKRANRVRNDQKSEAIQ
ncbi:hypothetical protein [Maritimibacter sp. DP1N21-5]|uniref:hypothetical protein n=1 Tax=Maritimibacter sp. DP1N21-5 TaxID=2836867 RepID=UPI001C44F124|nr:hypothetical protein [Maritimibacter sp. DP1N21-5]MBV7407886.1 hypothetical protein [Maritimibacter sp. DP1N21-5]